MGLCRAFRYCSDVPAAESVGQPSRTNSYLTKYTENSDGYGDHRISA